MAKDKKQIRSPKDKEENKVGKEESASDKIKEEVEEVVEESVSGDAITSGATDDQSSDDQASDDDKTDEEKEEVEDQKATNSDKVSDSDDSDSKEDKTKKSEAPDPDEDSGSDEKDAEEKEKEYDPGDEHKLQEKGTSGKKISGHIVINKKDNPQAKWFVVHTASGHEVRVAETLRQRVETTGLEDKIYELLVPTQDRVIIRGGKKQNIKEKIFPGYLLVKLVMDDATWLAVRTTPGITGFVGTGKTPSPLSEMEVANIQKFVATPAKRFKTKFTKGEAVKITDGPFSGFLGSVDDIDEEKGKVKVLVSIFGRETPVELDLLQITKV